MKIDKQKFLESYRYIQKINQIPFDDLDFSEFGPEEWCKISKEEFKYTGLANQDFITMNWEID